jgi:hypothetical protein
MPHHASLCLSMPTYQVFYFCGREGGICERTQIDFCGFVEDLRKSGLNKVTLKKIKMLGSSLY